jgi:hypothetical protein
LRDVERLTLAQVRERLAAAPVQPGGGTDTPAAIAVLARPLLRAAAARLGSTVLVSHLGTVRAGDVAEIGFYPVSGGGSGLSLGAVTTGSGTTLTLRGRARQHDDAGLQRLLARVVDALDDPY